jgi:MFS family permease
MVGLAVAMGLGRFAFTPILPMMLQDGLLDLRQASWLASSNYLGYLLGALACALQPWLWRRMPSALGPAPRLSFALLIRLGLVATALLTLAMALPWPPIWAGLRWAAGLASALVFVYGSGWCLSQLTRLGKPNWGGLIYMGPGVGIAISGLAGGAMVAHDWSSPAAWLSMGALAVLGTALVWPVLGEPASHEERLVAAAPAADAATGGHGLTEQALLVLGYGLAGFGYIISATFLPVIARTALPGSVWLDLFWPLFGLGVALGALLSTRLPSTLDKRALLVASYLVQALGIAVGLYSPSVQGFVVGSMLLGLPFSAIGFFAMQEARRIKGGTAAGFMGLLTATYGLGQVLGPLLVAELLRSNEAARGFDLALGLAAASLLLGAALFAGMMRRYRTA